MEMGSNPLVSWLDWLIDCVMRNKTKIFLGFVAVVITVVSFFVYRFYQQKVQTEAHQDFMEALSAFDVPVQGFRDRATPVSLFFNSEEEKWKKVISFFEKGYQRHKHSGE